MLQCVVVFYGALHYAVMQCVAVCCRVLLHCATVCYEYNLIERPHLCISIVSQCVAMCCSVLQCVAVCYSVLQCLHKIDNNLVLIIKVD